MAQMRRAIRWTAALALALFVLGLAPVGAEGASAPAQDRKLVPVGREAGGRRVALVIGNDAYQDAPLRNAGNDARAVAAELAALPEPFTVTSLFNATQAQLATAIARFTDSLRKQDVAFVFYAGHGVQFGSDNYLVPVDYTGQSQAEARLRMIPLSVLHEGVQAAGVGIIVLDACRNNPFKGTRAAGGGLGVVEARGTLIAYATGAGQTAGDNPQGGNGLFTRELVSALREPGLTVYEVFRRVRERVRTATNGVQAPAVYEDLIGDVVLRSTAVASKPADRPTAPASVTDSVGSAPLTFESDAGLVMYLVKPDRTAEFETVVRQVSEGLAASSNKLRREQMSSWKVFRSIGQDSNQNFTYVLVLDPPVRGADYRMSAMLVDAFPGDYENRFRSFLAACTGLIPVRLTLVADFRSLGSPPPPSSRPGTPGALERSFSGDAAALLYFVKSERTTDFVMVIAKLQEALARSQDPVRRQQAAGWKVFDAGAGGPGETSFLFMMDPVVKGADYSLSKIWAEAFPAEAGNIYQAYKDAVSSGIVVFDLKRLIASAK